MTLKNTKHNCELWLQKYWLGSRIYLKSEGQILILIQKKSKKIINIVLIFMNLFFKFQAGLTPCTSGGKGKKSILPSCIARTGSEEELQELAKRPISPGHRGTTWNGNDSSLECFILLNLLCLMLIVGRGPQFLNNAHKKKLTF